MISTYFEWYIFDAFGNKYVIFWVQSWLVICNCSNGQNELKTQKIRSYNESSHIRN